MAWHSSSEGIIISALIRIIIETIIKIVFLFFVIQFGGQVKVKSFMHANGDLIIVGEDDQKNTIFAMVIKANENSGLKESRLLPGDSTDPNTTME